jgi:peptidoglycan/xylan/chitin deacetylase (PgdA/CDA1 family)
MSRKHISILGVFADLLFNNKLDFGPAILISFDVESPLDSYIREFDVAKNMGHRNRVGFRRLLSVSYTYEAPFTLFTTGHALLEECKGHRTLIRIVRGNRKYGFRVGEYDWHFLDPASNYVEHPEFYYGDLVKEAIKSGVGHEIASHSFSHIPYPLVDDETAERDLTMSTELLESYGIKPVSFAFPYNLMGKTQLFSKHGIRIVRVGHKMVRNITYKDGLVMVKSNITDLAVDSLRWWIKIVDLMVKRRTLLNWYLHPATLYDDKAYKLFEEIVKYMIKKEVNFLTYRKFIHSVLSKPR